ncbi:MAG TPA: hemerythrin domain-containing protein [Mycobacteriales bacterium]|nr:hemerythrin domain-containing protein [Mycobacteriales bacterium]
MSQDVVDLIMNDHREVERLFAQLKAEPATRANVVPVLTTLLTAHSRAEEAEVYPAAKSEAGETEEVEHSQEEHLEADKLLKKLIATDPTAPEFETALAELEKAITHHVEEEESKVLPGLRSGLEADRLVSLGEAFLASREEHLGEQPVDLRKQDLLQQAMNAGLPGAWEMSKDELEKALSARAES